MLSPIPERVTALPANYEAVSPPQEDISALFADYLRASGEDPAGLVPIGGLYGAVKLPSVLPKIVVSVDFCEVLRRTGGACGAAVGNLAVEYPYRAIVGIGDDDIAALVRALMKTDRVSPTEGVHQIVDILGEIRLGGGLVIGNTSTLTGCEEATLKFITKHYSGAFDGVNFNTGGHHFAESTRTKAWAILSVLRQIDSTFEPAASRLAIWHIDDRPHHNASFHEVFAGGNVRTYAPLCLGEAALDHGQSRVFESPLAAFRQLRIDASPLLAAQQP